MSEDSYFKFSNRVLLVPMIAVLLIWTVFWVEIRFQVNLNQYGVYPRTLKGLRGVFFSPFLHGSIEHLYNNTIPIAILTASLVYFYRSVSFKVLLWGVLFSGLLTWVIGRPSYHIGASGLIYVLASFIFFKGIFTKHYRLVALSLMVVFIVVYISFKRRHFLGRPFVRFYYRIAPCRICKGKNTSCEKICLGVGKL